ncbi:MAG: hypothetical protein A2934_01635 [Candidatus Sungbacteria bacterium RIFCSPLOWO2_01_FULL_47_10]|uniref:Tyrosine--tRNA ligase n=1 Tax=Candidatus Sungbacteria bacterium RIFCSPLOWO2_01_FULL_47_10 TaxID=1802276 RepID=A0A1G2L7P9_9BACT|nr:MAG: hypothetical protein A2934_01635 [Candidatus Sungbacteria bacterium RIFCSPLOWO2_01_FULL_47_10]
MKTSTDKKRIEEIFNRGIVVKILPDEKSFLERLFSGERLKIYVGADPTSDSLHLSHAKNYMFLEELRQLGHEVIILIGDFTARIGDPTGRMDARARLSDAHIKKNVAGWLSQIKPLMNFNDKKNPPKIVYNNAWLSKLSLGDIVALASNFTVQQMLERDMFRRRFYGEWKCTNCGYPNMFDQDFLDKKIQFQNCSNCASRTPKNEVFLQKESSNKKPIFLHEFLYPLMQGYDSVALDVDAELCGTDQIFNALAGRTLLKRLKNKEKFVIVVNLMENPKTHELMSKSRGTGVFLSSGPTEMYGAIMAQPDEMIEVLFINCTRIPLSEKDRIMALGPRDAKARIAREIVSKFYGEKKAADTEKDFIKTFSQKKPDKASFSIIHATKEQALTDFLYSHGLASSKSEARRLILNGAVEIGGEILRDPREAVFPQKNTVIRVGKKKFVRVG